MKRWAALLVLTLAACVTPPGSRPDFADATADFVAEQMARREVRKNDRATAVYRKHSQRALAKAARLDERHRDMRVAINREVAAEVAVELARRSPLGHGAVVALFPVEAPSGIDPTTTDAIDALLFLELTKSNRFRFVPRREVEGAIDRITSESFATCADERCAIEIGRAVAAERVLAPRLYAAGDTCVLALTLYDLRTETGEWATTTKAPCEDRALRDAVTTIAARLEPPKIVKRHPVTAERPKPKKRTRPARTPFVAE